MKTSKYIFLSLAAAFVATACNQEMNPDNPNKANPGDEVQFGLSLPGKTKTIYGEENTETKTFPIYWANGDKVKVASPQCQSGRNNAEYAVSVKTAKQSYADTLKRTGEYGVQWGSEEIADFYSIYPSTAGTTLNINGKTVTATLHVDATQFANTSSKKDAYNKEYFYSQPAEMGNVVMYAKAESVDKGATVELHYTPFSTVLEFELTAPGSTDENHQADITIQSITLVAPTGTIIAGDFIFKFPTETNASPSVSADASGSNVITLHFLNNNQYTTKLNTSVQTLKAKMCVMPISGVKNLSGWKVEVATSAGTFSKTLTEQTGELKPGLVHKIKLPQLKYGASEWVFKPGNWIPSLPDYGNIYLSELSLPGAWYAGSDEAYQETSDIATLWNAGVRAFAVETKTSSSYTWNATYTDYYGVPQYISVSGTAGNSGFSYRFGTNSLHSDSKSDAKVYKTDGTNISTVITNVAKQVSKDEYAVLVLSYADGGSSGMRYVDFGAWMKLLYDTYNTLDASVKTKIYQNEVTSNTTVKDVLGKLILKINVDENIAKEGYLTVKDGWFSDKKYTYVYEDNLPAVFSYNPFIFQMNESDKYSVPFFSNLSCRTWGDDTDTHRKYMRATEVQSLSNPFVWCFSSANRTQEDTGTDGTIPTYANRKAALGAMMEYSKQIYEASTHNVWFYFNCGGTQATSQTSSSPSPSPTAFATKMNKWLLDEINAKTDPSPLGIVMFNQCTSDTYYGPAIIRAIIEMNSKFYLKHAGTSGGSTGGSTDGSGSETAQNDVLVTNGGDAI